MGNMLKLLAIETGLGETAISRISNTAPLRYKTYFILKRDGSKRKISQPARELKLVQRALVDVLLKKLPVHHCATAYRENLSILDNARPHAGNGPIIKMDFKNFFPSIKKNDWVAYCKRSSCLQEIDDIDLTSQILFQKQKEFATLRLAIGAPSSPMLSNILMYDFDELIYNQMRADNVIYTRYADDLTFSARRTGFMHNVKKNVYLTTKSLKHPRLKINDSKTHYITPKYKRSVTGLVLSTDGRITIGHVKKRQLHAAVHNLYTKGFCQHEIPVLAGMLAYVNAVEPGFIEILRKKYGHEIILKIQKSVKVTDKNNDRSK